MLRSDFQYELPEELIARFPAERRSDSRLLHLAGGTGAIADRRMTELPGLLRAGDLLVFNDTRVIPARMFGRKDTGGRIEILLERVTGPRQALVQLRASKPPRAGATLRLDPAGDCATVLGREGDFWQLEFTAEPGGVFARLGTMPLPPYLERPAVALDFERYQTVFARRPGAVAAPTAGLHFDAELLEALGSAGVSTTFVTLHVGAGTFQPVRALDIADHQMHVERLSVSAAACDAVGAARRRGGRVVAVGTTSVRALETAAADGTLAPYEGDTRLFITPGYQFRVVDALLTNFHLPESTLLMLVCAFAGQRSVMAAYRHAVEARYRFFSYGDAMLAEPAPGALAARAGV
jgi:S-adenosylmethionine:tRNA ribosyltransferase-isomerase